MIKRYSDFTENNNSSKNMNEGKTTKNKKSASAKDVQSEANDIVHNDYQKNIVDPTVKANTPENVPVQPDVENNKKKKVEIYGKIAKFPKDTKASEAYSFIDKNKDIKVKSTIWYMLIEKQSDKLQMVRFDLKKGVNMNAFVTDLKKYYIDRYKDNTQIVEAFNALEVCGTDKFSTISNIQQIDVDGKKLITRIVEDLVKLLK